jgi:hypothetical protein
VGRETIKIGKDLFQGNASPTVPGFRILGLYRKSVHEKVGRNRHRGSSLKGSCAGKSVHEKVGRKPIKGEFELGCISNYSLEIFG